MSNVEISNLNKISKADPYLGKALGNASPEVWALFYADMKEGKGDNAIGRFSAGVLSSILTEAQMTDMYLANLSDRAGENKGAFDSAMQRGLSDLANKAQTQRNNADTVAEGMKARGVSQELINAYIFKEYANAAASEKFGKNLMGSAQFLGDYFTDPTRVGGNALRGGVQALDTMLMDDTKALEYLRRGRDGVVAFTNADIRSQATTVGNGAGNVATVAVEAAAGYGAGRLAGAVRGAGGAGIPDVDVPNVPPKAPDVEPTNPRPGGANSPNTDLEAGGAISFMPEWRNADGSWRYPTAASGFPDGFGTPPIRGELSVGTRIDRYGSERGGFLAPEGTPYGQRALPPDAIAGGYRVYEVMKPLPIDSGPSAPWFNQPGGGTQYRTLDRQSVSDLVRRGFLKCVKGPGC